MNILTDLGTAVGLAGASAYRGIFPLIFAIATKVLDLPPTLRWLGSAPVLFILLVLMVFEFIFNHFPGISFLNASVYAAVKVVIGGFLFTQVLGLNVFLGMILGGLVTGFFIFSRLMVEPLVEEEIRHFRNLEYVNVENIITIVLTILTISLPWLNLIILGIIIYGVVRNGEIVNR